MSADELHFLEIAELSRLLAARKVSPVELTEAMLRRIERVDPTLKSYALVTPELALAQARAAEQMIGRRQILSQLHGVPVAVKDLCWTEGIATAAGMPLHRDFIPPADATVVKKLREAGAVLLGKLQLTEGAFADHHPEIAPPVNPWHRDHWSGASSSGSGVATAAGLCFGSLGSDTGGSIRFPSAANGVTGLKPTWGRVSRFGCFELAASLDENDFHSCMMLLTCFQDLGDHERKPEIARQMLERSERVLAQDSLNASALGVSAAGLTILGDLDRAKERIHRATVVDPDNINMPYNFACMLATWVGDTEGALKMLEPIMPRVSRSLLLTTLADPDMDPLRDDPRFKKMVAEAMERTGLTRDMIPEAARRPARPSPAAT
jgi:hypothetical protein